MFTSKSFVSKRGANFLIRLGTWVSLLTVPMILYGIFLTWQGMHETRRDLVVSSESQIREFTSKVDSVMHIYHAIDTVMTVLDTIEGIEDRIGKVVTNFGSLLGSLHGKPDHERLAMLYSSIGIMVDSVKQRITEVEHFIAKDSLASLSSLKEKYLDLSNQFRELDGIIADKPSEVYSIMLYREELDHFKESYRSDFMGIQNEIEHLSSRGNTLLLLVFTVPLGLSALLLTFGGIMLRSERRAQPPPTTGPPNS